MVPYLDTAAAIIDLHERGFSEDFTVVGDRLLWIQRKLFFNATDFHLDEAHCFVARDGSERVILGACLLPHFAGGIIMWQLNHTSDPRSAALNNQIEALLVKSHGSNSDVKSPEFFEFHLQ